MPKVKCYLSGAVTGLKESEYTKNFNQAKKEVESFGFEAVNPVELDHDHNKEWSSYMKEAIIEMLKCDAIYMIKGYGKSKGAMIEVGLAVALKMNIIYQK